MFNYQVFTPRMIPWLLALISIIPKKLERYKAINRFCNTILCNFSELNCVKYKLCKLIYQFFLDYTADQDHHPLLDILIAFLLVYSLGKLVEFLLLQSIHQSQILHIYQTKKKHKSFKQIWS